MSIVFHFKVFSASKKKKKKNIILQFIMWCGYCIEVTLLAFYIHICRWASLQKTLWYIWWLKILITKRLHWVPRKLLNYKNIILPKLNEIWMNVGHPLSKVHFQHWFLVDCNELIIDALEKTEDDSIFSGDGRYLIRRNSSVLM